MKGHAISVPQFLAWKSIQKYMLRTDPLIQMKRIQSNDERRTPEENSRERTLHMHIPFKNHESHTNERASVIYTEKRSLKLSE